MADWKESLKGHISLSVSKVDWSVSNSPWMVDTTVDKKYYDEGNIVTDFTNPIYSLEHSGIADNTKHNPCGYWYRGFDYVLTSTPYPIEVVEKFGMLGNSWISGGSNIRGYDHEYATITSNTILSGVFSIAFYLHTITVSIESFDITSNTVLSGVFNLSFILDTITVPVESFSISDYTLVSGAFNIELITYSYWVPEGFQVTGNTLLGGTFNAP